MLTLTSPINTWAHRVPAGVKLLALAGLTGALFSLQSPVACALAALGVVCIIATGGVAFASTSLAQMRPVWPFVLIVSVWHLATADLAAGSVVILRMMTAIAAANFVTMTTRLSAMLAVLEQLLSPLAAFGLRPRPLAMAFALVIRFVPVMLQRFDTLSTAFRARSPRRSGWRILMPATLAALDDADRVAEALRARGGIG